MATHLHWGIYAVLADDDAARRHGAIRLLYDGHKYAGAGGKQSALARDEGDDRYVPRHDDPVLAVLISQRERAAIGLVGRLGNGGIRHHALGRQVPGIVAFAGAASRFRENEHFD